MNKAYLRQVLLYVLTAVLSVSLTLYIGYHLFYGLTQKVVTEVAVVTHVAEALSADFYIFRDEIPLYARTEGSSVPAVADGARVGVGDVVARTYTVSSPDTVERIAGLDRQLEILAGMKQQQLSVRDTAATDAEIYGAITEIAALSRAGNASGILSLRADLLASLNRRAIITGSATDIASAERALREERDTLTAALGACRETVTVTVSGNYYATSDGLESLFTAETAETMTPAEFDTLVSTATPTSDGYSAGKIAPDYIWYAACRVPATDTVHLEEGRRYSIRFPYSGGATVTVTLARLVPDGEDVMLVFRADRLPANLTLSRSQSGTLDTFSHTGLAVPTSAVRVRDGVSGVYILSGSVVSFRAIEILYETAEICVAALSPEEEAPQDTEWLQQNDRIITEGRGLYDGRVLS